jgi:glyoxylase-like metal-dependent hydrolase (beta-lactamase superfamily II)
MTSSSTTSTRSHVRPPAEQALDERDGRYLRKAIYWSHAASRRGNRPFGAIVVSADGEVIAFGHHQLKVLHTPGHTPGGVVFYCEQERTAFSGDTLFRMSIGRTDFEKGSYEQIIDSLHNVIAKLPADTTVYTGHGPLTVVGEEVAMSPYFR